MFDRLNQYIICDGVFNPQIVIDLVVYCSFMLEFIIFV